jgi:archaeosine synthase
MQEIISRDGLARLVKWHYGKETGEGADKLVMPELLFVQTGRIPVAAEARVVLTADPSLSDTAFIYQRGNRFSPQAVYNEDSSTADSIKGSLIAQIPPFLWKPVGAEQFMDDIDLNEIPKMDDNDEGTELECGDSDNVRVIFDSTTDDELKECRFDKNLDLVILGNSMELFDRPRKFTEAVMRIKKVLGQRVLLYTPTLGEPSHLALLAYMGIDLFDTLPLIAYSRKGIILTETSKVSADEVADDWFCTCPFCQDWSSEETRKKPGFELILGHNYLTALQELSLVRHAVRTGMLRELVEARIAVEPRAVNILRFIDNNHYEFIEEYIPIARKTQIISCTQDSLSRPEVKRFQSRIRERYTKPEFAQVLLLLQCSAHKPYSQSKSHQAYMFALRNSKNPMVVQEVILTSPLGIVPRELELAYPAQHYDIPVTGTWYEEEKSVVRNQLSWLLENFEYRSIIAHLDKEQAFLVEGFEHIDITGGENATSKKSLTTLTSALNDAVGDCLAVQPNERRHQMMTRLTQFHFGKDAGSALTEGAEFKGSYPYLKILYKGKQLGMIEASTGLISLTLEGGERILQAGVYGVEIEEFELKGDIFAPGVREGDPIIRPNDEVVVFSKSGDEKVLKAVGRAQMPGSEMGDSEKGRAVKVRHFVK